MKLETFLRCPQLSAIIDSNEAHIRLMFGTWLAFRHSRFLTAIGAAAALGMATGVLARVAPGWNSHLVPAYWLWFVVATLLLWGTYRGSKRIESLFHYRRVRELFDIVACYHLALQGFDSAGQPHPRVPKPTTS